MTLKLKLKVAKKLTVTCQSLSLNFLYSNELLKKIFHYWKKVFILSFQLQSNLNQKTDLS